MPFYFSVNIDDDADTPEELIRLAFERARQTASDDPGQTMKGFRIAVCDEDDNLFFEVTAAPPTRH